MIGQTVAKEIAEEDKSVENLVQNTKGLNLVNDGLKNGIVGKTPTLSQDATKEEYDRLREEMIKTDKGYHFTVDVPELTPDEMKVDAALLRFKGQLVKGDNTPMLLEYYEGKKIIENSALYHALQNMPKGGHLHLHPEAAVPMEVFLNFTREDYVYYSMEEDILRTAPKGLDLPGYEKCNTLRENWDQEGTFDEYMAHKVLLTSDEIISKESLVIWQPFEHKFTRNYEIVHYYKFYKEILFAIWRQAVKDGLTIVELRHASCILFDDDREYLTFKQEFDLYQEVIDEIKKQDPDFELRIIVVALKVGGKEVCKQQLESYLYAMDNGYDFVTGFDMVNEEDVVEPIYYFIDEILEAKKGYPNFNFFFHAGESIDRYNENLYDAVLLGTKRIGHGVAIQYHPHLLKIIKERNIGYEICPISHFILGYTLDMRAHPVRNLMANGVAVTISSDAPEFWGYSAITLDFTYAFVCWQLDLRDMKQLAINSIKQSSISEELREKHLEIFYKRWDKFIDDFLKQHPN